MISRTTIGTPVTWIIGTRGGPQDRWPARTLSRPLMLRDERGRQQIMVEILVYRKNQAGDWYTNQRTVAMTYLIDRTTRVEALDGPKGESKTIETLLAEHAASLEAYSASQEQELSTDALEAMLTA